MNDNNNDINFDKISNKNYNENPSNNNVNEFLNENKEKFIFLISIKSKSIFFLNKNYFIS